jgi:hypothetical protein
LNPVEFVVDYCQRHAHPVNAVLHLIGVPAVFYGVYKLFCGAYVLALELIVIGYILQYFGHKAQGNEVGEVTLIKSIIRSLTKKTGNGHG